MKLLGAIEAGGTKFVCAVGSGPDDIHAVKRIPTTTPSETLNRVLEFFRSVSPTIDALGIGSFGPVDVNESSDTHGYITSTPKKGWANTNFGPFLAEQLECPYAFDTDVNAAALGEYRWGAAQGLDTFIYLTVGTGIGGGGFARGNPLHGMVHPEMGHVLVPLHPDDQFEGVCPFHGTCLEGMASGPAVAARWGQSAELLRNDHPAWPLEAYYLGTAVANFILTLSPQRVILGGGLMNQDTLFPLIRKRVKEALNDYVKADPLLNNLDTYIVEPGLGDRAGVLGALALALDL